MGTSAVSATSVNLQQFSALADAVGEKNLDSAVKLGRFSHQLRVARLPTFRSTNAEMRESFIAAVRTQMGDSAADAVARFLDQPGKPLTARKIRSAIDVARQQVQRDIQSAAAREVSFARAVAAGAASLNPRLDAWMDRQEACRQWGPIMRDLFKRVVVDGMASAYRDGEDLDAHFGKAMDADGLATRILGNVVDSGSDSNALLVVLHNVKPSEIGTMLKMHDMFSRTNDAVFARLLGAHAGELAALDKSGKLSLDTAWPVLFHGEKVPEEYHGHDKVPDFQLSTHLGDVVAKRVGKENWEMDPKFIAQMVTFSSLGMSIEDMCRVIQGKQAVEIHDSPTLRMNMLSGDLGRASGLPTCRAQLYCDIRRCYPVVRIAGGAVEGGLTYNFQAHEDDNGEGGAVDRLVTDLTEQIAELCGRDHMLQIAGVIMSLTQNAQIVDQLSLVGDQTKNIEPLPQPRLSGFGAWITKGQDGSVLVTLTPGPEANVVSDRTYRFRPDGRQELVACPERFELSSQPRTVSKLAEKEICRAKLVEVRTLVMDALTRPEVGPQSSDEIIASAKQARWAALEGVCDAIQSDPRVPAEEKQAVVQCLASQRQQLDAPAPQGIRGRVETLLQGVSNAAVRGDYLERLFPGGRDSTNLVQRDNHKRLRERLADTSGFAEALGRAPTAAELARRSELAERKVDALSAAAPEHSEGLLADIDLDAALIEAEVEILKS